MADLYNLLDELEENEGYDDEKQDPRRLTVDTAATERLSDDDCEDYDDTAPTPQVPAALLEQDDSDDHFHPGKTSADSFSKEGLDIHDDLDKTNQKQYEIPNELRQRQRQPQTRRTKKKGDVICCVVSYHSTARSKILFPRRR
eukprot:CAMPEP_0168181970 /NCGR_PEP_ID=MMETSP0139_2-20121125/11581_1 /TAXON_ID=44445 /ORGANISM="Pseudo-nitzschia australis, Strain 10249 10 AB" /LENGTH=142 /DNA_ID=CAMNT_0008102743 /DNA_START=45 /DNA_END=473 /DNA_ORIENTATION=+